MSNGRSKIIAQVYLEFCGTYEENSNGYTDVFKIKLFNGANIYVAGSRYVTGNRYGGQQTGNNDISCCRTARQIIQTRFSTFSRVRYTTVQR